MANEEDQSINALLQELSIPRLSGSPNDQITSDIITHHLTDLGSEPQIESILASLTPMNWIQPLLGYLIGILFAIPISFWRFSDVLANPILGILCAILAFVIDILIIAGKIENYNVWYPTIKTHNLIVKQSSIDDAQEKPTIILIAHRDSKSQIIGFKARTIFYFLGLIGCGLWLICYLLIQLFYLIITGSFLHSLAIEIVAWFFIITLWIWSSNRIKNQSPGANDNASGIITLIKLIQKFKEPIELSPNIYFVFSGAEELGVYGAMQFVKNHLHEFPKGKTYCISIDTVGGPIPFVIFAKRGIPKQLCGPTILNAMNQASNTLHIPINPIYLPFGDLVDYHPFILQHIESLAIGTNSPYLHGRNDTIANTNEESINQCIELVYETVKNLVENAKIELKKPN
jgi:hypothetical protein